MLIGKFRDGLKSKAMQYFLIFMCAALVFGVGFFKIVKRIFTGRTGGEIAIINKQGIDRIVFLAKKQEMQEQFNMLYRQFGAYTPFLLQQQGINPDPEKAALDILVRTTLIDQAIQSFPLYIDSEYVKNKIYDPYFMYSHFRYTLPQQFVVDNKIDSEAYLAFIKSLPSGAFVNEVTHALQEYVLNETLTSASYIPQSMLRDLLSLRAGERDYHVYTISLDDVKKHVNKNVNDAELHKFYSEQNSKTGRYSTPARRSGILWTFNAKDFPISITDKEIEQQYNRIKQTQFVSKPTKVTVREIVFNQVKEKGLKQLLKDAQDVEQLLKEHPEKFDSCVKEYSTGESAKQNGLVSYVKGKSKDKSIEKIAFRLKKDGDISEIITLDKQEGYAIIKRISREDVEYKPLSSVKKTIEDQLQQKKFATVFTSQANRVIKAKSDTAQKDYEEFLQKYKAQETKIDPTAKEETPLISRLFAMKKTGDKVAYVVDGKGYILILDAILKKTEIPFDMIKTQVAQDYHEIESKKELEKRVISLKDQVKNGSPVDTLAKKTVFTAKGFNEESIKAAQEKGIALESGMFLCEKVGSVVSGMTEKNGQVIQLIARKPVTSETDSKLKQEIETEYQRFDAQAYIASLYRSAKIEVLLENAAGNNSGDYNDYQI